MYRTQGVISRQGSGNSSPQRTQQRASGPSTAKGGPRPSGPMAGGGSKGGPRMSGPTTGGASGGMSAKAGPPMSGAQMGPQQPQMQSPAAGLLGAIPGWNPAQTDVNSAAGAATGSQQAAYQAQNGQMAPMPQPAVSQMAPTKQPGVSQLGGAGGLVSQGGMPPQLSAGVPTAPPMQSAPMAPRSPKIWGQLQGGSTPAPMGIQPKTQSQY